MEWFRDLPSIPKLVIVGLAVLVLVIILSPVAVIVAALLLGASIIALIIRVAQRRSIKNWGIVAVTSVVLMFIFGATSDALYGSGFLGSSGSDSGRGGGGVSSGQDGGGEKGIDTPSAGGGGSFPLPFYITSPSLPLSLSRRRRRRQYKRSPARSGASSRRLTYEGVHVMGTDRRCGRNAHNDLDGLACKVAFPLGLPGHRVRVHGEYQGFISTSGGGSYEAVMADAWSALINRKAGEQRGV